ncbi:glycoside hydrolase family 116 protein [Synechocystis sp. B12]|nr:glycoside hydrolase family 116 protein [Synechocystis sp. B12]
MYQDTLWNGEYYNLDSQSGSKVVMADQLCGQFYARLLNLPDVVEHHYAEKALAKVYDTCFLKFAHGELGAANGLLPDGSPKIPTIPIPWKFGRGLTSV